MKSHEYAPFLLLQTFLLISSFWILQNIFDIGGAIDLRLILPYINQNGEFTLRQSWALADLSHRYVKYLLTIVYLIFLTGWLMSLKKQVWYERCWEFGYFFWMIILTTVAIRIFKAQSAHSCPWDMVMSTPYGIAWNLNATAGHCFPGGHASTGFALMTGYFIYRISKPGRAYFFLISALILGFGMGWAQMMRGAHFLSHNLWTGWIIWFLNVVAYGWLKHKLPK